MLSGGSAAGIALAMLMTLEGLSLSTYKDTASIDTICYGHTATARPGQTLTQPECDKLLNGDLGVFKRAVERAVKVPIPETMKAAIISWAYNVGIGAMQTSTLIRLLNQGQYEAACMQMNRWICEVAPKGKGDTTGQCAVPARNKRISKGLINRRKVEVRICLHDI